MADCVLLHVTDCIFELKIVLMRYRIFLSRGYKRQVSYAIFIWVELERSSWNIMTMFFKMMHICASAMIEHLKTPESCYKLFESCWQLLWYYNLPAFKTSHNKDIRVCLAANTTLLIKAADVSL